MINAVFALGNGGTPTKWGRRLNLNIINIVAFETYPLTPLENNRNSITRYRNEIRGRLDRLKMRKLISRWDCYIAPDNIATIEFDLPLVWGVTYSVRYELS